MSIANRVQVVGASGPAAIKTRTQTPTGLAMQVQIGPGDVISNIPVVIEYDHHQVHEGEVWQYTYYPGSVGAGTRNIRISVPTGLAATTQTPHFLLEVISDATTVIATLFEGPTFSSAGTNDSARIRNRNRNVGGSPSTKVYITGATALTVSATGLNLTTYFISSAKSTGSDRALAEWDLKRNTDYLIQLVSTGTGTILARLNWYEDLGV